MSDWYIYAVAVEAFFLRAMRDRLDEGARQRIAEAGIELGRPLLAAYPADVFHRAVAIAAEAVRPELMPSEAHRLAGREHLDGFVESYSGRMMLAVARQLEPRTIVEYTGTFIRLGNNFTETTARATGPDVIELWFNEVGGVPGWYQGIIERGLELSRVTGVTVTHLGGGRDGTFRVTWAGRGGGGLSQRGGAG
jgi:uncharacterized protein (TIGR02265 family)